MTKCAICCVRPSLNGNGTCHNCESKIDKERRSRKPEKAFRYVVYRDFAVGMYPSGKGTYRTRQIGINPARLPKSITINLNEFCDGFSKAQVKRLKTAVLRACSA